MDGLLIVVKALAQDQKASLEHLIQTCPGLDHLRVRVLGACFFTWLTVKHRSRPTMVTPQLKSELVNKYQLLYNGQFEIMTFCY